MRPEGEKYLRDMLDAVQAIDDQTRGMTRDGFLGNRVTRDAVTWNLCVTGEALSQPIKADEETGRQIADARKIVGLRNQLIHGYGVINHDITWRVVTEYLPPLRRQLEAMIGHDPLA